MYKAFFGLRAKPFRLNPDPRFLFASRGARRAMDFLKYGLYQREGLVLLTGASGVGKTLLLRNLLGRLPGDQASVAQIQPVLGDAASVLTQVAVAFGAAIGRDEGHNTATPLAALQRQLLVEAQAGRRALLFVDEAQNLDASGLELMRMLSNLQIGAASAVQVFLIARPEMRGTLAGAAFDSLRQRVVAADHLDALDIDEVGAYVGWRLRRAGWKEAALFDDAAIEAITAATAAVPRRINTLCDRLLMQAFVEGRTSVHGEDIAPVVDEMSAEWSPELTGPAEATALSPAPLEPRAAASATTDAAPPSSGPERRPAPGRTTTGRPAPGRVMIDRAAAAEGLAGHDPALAADEDLVDEPAEPDADRRISTLESRMAALEASTAQVAKVSRAILGRIDAGKPV